MVLVMPLVEHRCSASDKHCSTYDLGVSSVVPSGSARGARTRRDVVDAAITTWATNPRASLGAVADTAGVGRTTVHRYFPDRASLLVAVDQECWERFNAATNRAAITRGSGVEALERLLREVVSLGPVLDLVFADEPLVDPETWESESRPDPFGLVVERGVRDGSIDPLLPPAWVVAQCWAALFGASLTGRIDVTLRSRAGELAARTLLHGIAARR
jgi:TetR/AcrR family transcriptional regulator, repressor for lfrA